MSLSLGKIHYTREASARAFPPPLRSWRARKSVLAVEKNAKYRGEFAGIIHTGARGKMPRINRGQETRSLSLSLSGITCSVWRVHAIFPYTRSGPLAAATTTTRLHRWDQPHCLFHKQISLGLLFRAPFFLCFLVFSFQRTIDELASFSSFFFFLRIDVNFGGIEEERKIGIYGRWERRYLLERNIFYRVNRTRETRLAPQDP